MNRWCHDLGREQAASKPLLRTVFQVVCSHEFASVWYSIYTLTFLLFLGHAAYI